MMDTPATSQKCPSLPRPSLLKLASLQLASRASLCLAFYDQLHLVLHAYGSPSPFSAEPPPFIKTSFHATEDDIKTFTLGLSLHSWRCREGGRINSEYQMKFRLLITFLSQLSGLKLHLLASMLIFIWGSVHDQFLVMLACFDWPTFKFHFLCTLWLYYVFLEVHY